MLPAFFFMSSEMGYMVTNVTVHMTTQKTHHSVLEKKPDEFLQDNKCQRYNKYKAQKILNWF